MQAIQRMHPSKRDKRARERMAKAIRRTLASMVEANNVIRELGLEE